MDRNRFIVANWKNYVKNEKNVGEIIKGIVRPSKCDTKVIVCPSFVHIKHAIKEIGRKNILLGVQDIDIDFGYPITGNVTADMLSDKVSYSIVGHSETRKEGVTDAQISEKVKALVENNISPIICIGEINFRDRFSELQAQVEWALSLIEEDRIKDIIFAYEPVSYIGQEEALDPRDIHQAVLYVRGIVRDIFSDKTIFSFPILYGGSVNKINAPRILESGNVDGFLLGRAGVDIVALNEIIDATCK